MKIKKIYKQNSTLVNKMSKLNKITKYNTIKYNEYNFLLEERGNYQRLYKLTLEIFDSY